MRNIINKFIFAIIGLVICISLYFLETSAFADKYYVVGWVCNSNYGVVFWVCTVIVFVLAMAGLKFAPYVSILGIILGEIIGECIGIHYLGNEHNVGWFVFIIIFFVVFVISAVLEFWIKNKKKQKSNQQ